MTESGSSPEPKKSAWKVTLMQGVIGAVSLAGTTAIPLLVNRYLSPTPTPTNSPTTEATPTQVVPVPGNSAAPVQTLAAPVTPAQTTPATPVPTSPVSITPVATPPVPTLPALSEPVPPPPPEILSSPPSEQLQSVDSQPEQMMPIQNDEDTKKGKKGKKHKD